MITADDLRGFAAALGKRARHGSTGRTAADIVALFVAAADRIEALEQARSDVIELCAKIAEDTIFTADSPILMKAMGVIHAGACLQVARRIRDLARSTTGEGQAPRAASGQTNADIAQVAGPD